MLNTFIGLLAGVLSLVGGFFSAAPAYGVAVFQTLQGGSGTSSPSGILYGDNGATTHLNTVTIGSNLTFSGGTLSATGGGGSGTVSTSTNETSGSLSYWTSNSATPALLGKVATSTLTAGTVLAFTGANPTIIGSASQINTQGGTFGAGNYVFPSNATTTVYFYAGTASSSSLYGADLTTCTGGNVLTWSGGLFGCAVDQTSAGGFSTTSADYWITATTTLPSITALPSTVTFANGLVAQASSTFVADIRNNGIFHALKACTNSTTLCIVGPSNSTGFFFPNNTSVGVSEASNEIALFNASGLTLDGLTAGGIVKADNTGLLQIATAGNDYQAPISATYPVQYAANVVSLGFSTTTNNTWSGAQLFTNASTTINGNATTTGTFFAAIASSSSLFGAMLATCNSGNFLQWAGGTFGCATPTGGGTGLSTTSPISAGNLLEYSSTGGGSAFGVATSTLTPSSPLTGSFTQVGSGGSVGCTTATSGVAGCLSNTAFDIFNNKIGWGQATSTSINQFVYTNNNGLLVSAASSSLNLPNSALTNSSVTINTNSPLGGGGAVSLGNALTLTCASCATFGYDWTPTTNYAVNTNATGTVINFTAGIQASSTSHFVNFDFTSATGTNIVASTTLAIANGLATTSLSEVATSTFAKGISGTYLNLTGASSATSTSSNGLDLSGGCFSIGGTCLQTLISSASAYKQAVKYASTSTLPSNNYSNGTGGVGATITGVGNGPLFIDGNTTALGDRILVKNEATGANNGIYTITTLGIAAVSPFVLTRATDYNSSLDVFPGVANFVNSGTVNANTCWILTNTTAVTIGTTALTYDDACGAGQYSGTWPIIISGTTFSFGGLTTSTAAVQGNIPYFSGVNTFANVATSSLSASSPLTGSFTQIGSGGSVGCQTASTAQAGCLAASDFALFNDKVATSTSETQGQLAAWGTTSGTPPKLYSIATSTATCSSGISCNTFTVVGSTNPSFTNSGVTSIAANSPITRDTATGAVTISCASCAIFGYDWLPATNFAVNTNSTTTALWLKAGIFASSTTATPSWIDQLNIGSTTSGTLATSTDYGNWIVKGTASSTALIVSNSINGPLSTDANGNVSASTTGAVTAGTGISLNSSVRQIFGGSLAITNSGVISGSCSGGTTCSGTNPLNISSFSYPFTVGTNFGTTNSNSTSTLTAFTVGIVASSTSYFNTISALTSSTTNASTTNLSAVTLAVGGAATSSIDAAGLIRAKNLTLFSITGTNNNCLQVDTNGVVSGTGSVCGGAGSGGIGDPFTHSANFGTTLASATTTPFWLQNYLFASSTSYLTSALLASSTAPQIFLSDTTSNSGYAFRSISGNLILATTTTTVVPMATSTFPILVANNNGYFGIGTSSPWARFTLDRYNTTSAYASSSILVTEYAIATSTNKTIDARDGNSQLFQIGSAATTITLSGFLAGTQLKLTVCNPNAVAGAITWASVPANILNWQGGTTTQTTIANKCDVYSFIGSQATSSASGALSKIFGVVTPSF